MTDINQRVKAIIEQVIYITIATTSADGQPWNTPVYSAYDAEYNFYWASYIGSQHSKNILANGKAFLAIYDSTIPAGEGEGAYIQATASEITDLAEIATAHELLRARSSGAFWKLEEVQPNCPVRIFQAIPKKVWKNDEGEADGTYIDTRTEVIL